MTKFNFVVVSFLLLSASLAQALIPTSKTILARTTHGHGKGAYVVEDDVTFKTEADPIVLHEKWLVVNADNMHLTVSRKGADDIHFVINYRSGKKTSLEISRPISLSPEFTEPYFYFRTPGSLQSSLVRAKVLPSDFGQKQRQIVAQNAEDKSENPALTSVGEPYVRLSRTNGVVAYELGRIAENENPGLWIEQDGFNIRKIKFPSMATMEADQYLSYANNFHFPRERTFKWGTNSVTARTISIRQATDQEAAKGSSAADDQASRVPEIPGIKEFYSRFR